MPERDGYIAGVPCWVDTSQRDPDAAAEFYGGLFGWEFEDAMPAGAPGGIYAEQVISYEVPAFRVEGPIVAGFAAFKDHLSYLPFSGSVLLALASELEGYTMTKSALHVPFDRPLSKALVRKLIAARRSEAPLAHRGQL